MSSTAKLPPRRLRQDAPAKKVPLACSALHGRRVRLGHSVVLVTVVLAVAGAAWHHGSATDGISLARRGAFIAPGLSTVMQAVPATARESQSQRSPEWQHTALGRREAAADGLAIALGLAGLLTQPAEAAAEAVFRTQREAPRVPKATAVMLLRTTYESVDDWGCYRNMGQYQKDFMGQMRGGFPAFRERYQNYDLSDLLNTSTLMQTGGGITNRLYFSFLNDAQWRTIGQAIKRPGDRKRFSRVVGDRLYRRILQGFELRADVEAPASEEDVAGGFNPNIGSWPPISPLPTGTEAADLAQGAGQLLSYLHKVGYCDGYELTDFSATTFGQTKTIQFQAFVRDPVNLAATASLMRSNEDFAPRYDQRILQAFFADRGFECEISDSPARSIDDTTPRWVSLNGARAPAGVRTAWTLRTDPDAGL